MSSSPLNPPFRVLVYFINRFSGQSITNFTQSRNVLLLQISIALEKDRINTIKYTVIDCGTLTQ